MADTTIRYTMRIDIPYNKETFMENYINDPIAAGIVISRQIDEIKESIQKHGSISFENIIEKLRANPYKGYLTIQFSNFEKYEFDWYNEMLTLYFTNSFETLTRREDNYYTQMCLSMIKED